MDIIIVITVKTEDTKKEENALFPYEEGQTDRQSVSDEECQCLLSVCSSVVVERKRTRRDDVPDGVDQPPAGTKSGGLSVWGPNHTTTTHTL